MKKSSKKNSPNLTSLLPLKLEVRWLVTHHPDNLTKEGCCVSQM